MNIYKRLIFSLFMVYGFAGQNGYTTSMQEIPPKISLKIFLSKADDMTFKELRDFSLISKKHYAQVVLYFKQRLHKLKTTPCPVLTEGWIDANSGKEFPKGTPDYYSKSRPIPIIEGSTKGQVTSINKINWAIFILRGNTVPARFDKNDLGSVAELKAVEKETIDGLGTFGVRQALEKEFGASELEEELPGPEPEYGPSVSKVCTYYSNNQKSESPDSVRITLSIADEFLELPELGIKGELR